MKPKYFFRKVKFLDYHPSHVNWKKLWIRLKDKDNVICLLSMAEFRLILIMDYKQNKPVVFARNKDGIVYYNNRIEDIVHYIMKHRTGFVDKKKYKEFEDWVLINDL